MANGHGLKNHPFVVIVSVIAGLIAIWSFVTEKPPHISEFRSFVEKLVKSPPSEHQQTEEANPARKQAERTYSEEAQQAEDQLTGRRKQQEAEAEAQRKAQERLTWRRKQEEAEAEAQRKEQAKTPAQRKFEQQEREAQKKE